MTDRIGCALLVVLLVGSIGAPAALGQGPGEGRGAGLPAAEPIERRLELATRKMDRDLVALLESRRMDCDGNDRLGGVETCWIVPAGSPAVAGPIGPVLR